MNFRTLDLNLLRVFDAVMSEGSLTRAAKRLAMSQPAVSHALKRLRDSVGEDLLVRTSRGVRPTPKAESLHPGVRAALAELEQTLAPAEFDPRRDTVNFQIVMADATAAMILPPVVAQIESERALANLRVLPLTTRDPRPMLEQGEVDLALGYFPAAVVAIGAEGPYSALRHERLYDTDYVCVMRRGHPLAAEPLTLDGFCAAHHLLVSYSGRAHGLVDQALAALGRRRRIVLTVNQFFTAGRVVTRSDLLTVLPRSFLPATGLESEIITRDLPLALEGVHVEALWHVRKDADSAHRWLRACLKRATAVPI